MKSTDEPVVVSEQFNLPIEEVWHAITTPERMRNWFFREMEDFQPQVGFETQFTIEHDGKAYTHQWKILEVIPQKLIVYEWRYANTPGQGKVIWELESSESGTQLRLTNSVVESFPDDDPAFLRESCLQGWQFIINDFLKEYLEPDAEEEE